MSIELSNLYAPFPPEEIEWRLGSTMKDKKRGKALAYIDARAVMDRLDAVCGPENWQCRYPIAGDKTCCEIGVKLGDEWVWKSDGAGDTNVEGSKGAFSTAFKRAAVRWGVGRYLYDLKAPWVDLRQDGNTHVIADYELTNLDKLAQGKPFTPSPPANSKDPEWQGPIKKVALQGELKTFITGLAALEDRESVNALVDEYHEILEQARHDTPGWMTGDGMPDEFVCVNERMKTALEKFA
jgi:hypothetical protein